jgi:Na+/H+ antiporter NhaD/arsenite permease-like protein
MPFPRRQRVAAGVLLALPLPALAAASGVAIDLTRHWAGFAAIGLFVLAYALVIAEEFTRLRKSQPVMLAAGAIWALLAAVLAMQGDAERAHAALGGYLLEYAELLLFLLAAMTYVNAMSERNVFEALRGWLLSRGHGYRGLFWLTGLLAFCLSPFLDNLTTALVMCAVHPAGVSLASAASTSWWPPTPAARSVRSATSPR